MPLQRLVSSRYVLALIDEVDVEEARGATRSLLLPRSRRFHWNAEDVSQRRRMLATLRASVRNLRVYACRPMPRTKQERARALCLNRLLWDLRDYAVERLVLESRQERNDRKDRLTIVRAQKACRAPALDYAFAKPVAEPLVWLADAGAGAAATELCGDDRGYLDTLGETVTVVEVCP